jgi:peptidoglycan/LPS O-acetylase OafA/YrhL
MRPEFPFLAAGTVAIAGGMAREKAWPKKGSTAVLATIILVIVASATSSTSLAPLVKAIGMLALLGSVMSATPIIAKAQKKGK